MSPTTWHTSPSCQGQTVETSYAWADDEALLRRTTDHSDGSTVIRRLEDPWSEADDPARVLELSEWRPWWDAPPWLDAALDLAPRSP